MKQKSEFLPVLLGTLAASVLGNASAERGLIRAGEGALEQMKTFNPVPSFD